MNIWTYWEGPKPPYIDLCLRSLQAVNGRRLVILTPDNLHEYLPRTLHDNWKRLPHVAVRSCCIRCAIVAEHGGWWIDADTVGLRRPHVNIEDFKYIQWDRKRVINGYFAAPPRHPTTLQWLSMINHVLANRFDDFNIWWLVLGEMLLTPSVVMHGGIRLPLSSFIPFNFDKNPRGMVEPGNCDDYIQGNTCCFALNNSWLRQHAPEVIDAPQSVQEDSGLLVHSVLNRARYIVGRESRRR